jgi:hypothetical protein
MSTSELVVVVVVVVVMVVVMAVGGGEGATAVARFFFGRCAARAGRLFRGLRVGGAGGGVSVAGSVVSEGRTTGKVSVCLGRLARAFFLTVAVVVVAVGLVVEVVVAVEGEVVVAVVVGEVPGFGAHVNK